MIRLPSNISRQFRVTAPALAALLSLTLAGCVSPGGGSTAEEAAAGAGANLIDATVAAAEKRERRRTQERRRAQLEQAHRQKRRELTANIADELLSDYERLTNKCFAPESKEPAGQAPLRRFMELSHEAEYGTGGGGGGGGGC